MPNDFWELTPSELNIIIEVYTQKQKDKYKNNVTFAYYNAWFQRAKNMPKLDEILEKIDKPKKKEMTDDDIFETVKRLHAKFGG
jgi:hypothetical protein